MISKERIQQIVEAEIRSAPLERWGMSRDAEGWNLGWIPLVAERIAQIIVELPLPPEGAQIGQDGHTSFMALQYTEKNPQAVKEFLGDAYEGSRGGITQDEPLVLFFTTKASFTVNGAHASELSLTEWIIKFVDPAGMVYLTSFTDEDYQRLYGR